MNNFCKITIILLFFSVTVNAATYYMATDGNNTTGNGSSITPWLTLQYSISNMIGGDTLIIKDGTYTGDSNTIYPWEYPPNGSEGAYTVIKAEHIGEVIFDGEGIRQLIDINGNGMNPQPRYIQFEGIIFGNSNGNCVSIVYANHIKILRCGMYNAKYVSDGTSASPLFFRYIDYALVEDTYIWGEGKYKFYLLDSNHLILRRCIERFDFGISTSGYHSSFRIYSCNHVELQNCISVDADSSHSFIRVDSITVVPTNAHFVIWSGGVNGPNDDVHIKGTIILNNYCGGRAYILQNSYQPQNNTIVNSVFWDIRNGLWTRLEVVEGTLFDHLTIGNSRGGGLTGEYGNGVIAKNNIVYGAVDYGLQWTDNPDSNSDYNVLYNNGYNYGSGASFKPHDFSGENSNEINPLSGIPGNGIPSLKYLLRIEDGSDLDGTASDGEDRGATILYKIGVDGTLWGEAGYDSVTNEPLWPFPNEDIIRERMKSYIYFDTISGDTLRGNRGFCKDTVQLNGTDERTLTSYIWEYLGNQMPDSIYGMKEIKNMVNAFPNPCRVYTGQRFITFNNLSSNDIIRIYNISGKLVHNSGNIINNNYRWSVGNTSSGVYFYKITGSSKASGKIVIIR